jgi:transketolase
MGVVEILCALFENFIDLDGSGGPIEHRNDFILSKGHAYLGLLATLCEAGRLPLSELMSYQAELGGFGAHPVRGELPEIISSNGSLGHGLPFGAGLALSKKLRGGSGKVFVLMGDGECSEGSVLEVGLIAPSLKLGNLIAVVDVNGFGNDGDLAYQDPEKVAGAFESFGWNVSRIDGNSKEEVRGALVGDSFSPTLLLAKTLKGKGIPGLEGSNESHHFKFVDRTMPNE